MTGTVRYMLEKKGRYYFNPTKALREAGFRPEPLGEEKSAAIDRAEALNAEWDQIQRARRAAEPRALSSYPEYGVWRSMLQRCTNPSCRSYPNYGGRGIAVCPEWVAGFDAFLADMGMRPTAQHSINRIDNNGDYTPDNCHWATPLEQASNMRANRLITANGETKTLAQWARSTGIDAPIIRRRISDGWTPERACTTPLTRASDEARYLREQNINLIGLVERLLDEDPNEVAADGGITVLDVWRHEARRVLGRERLPPSKEDAEVLAAIQALTPSASSAGRPTDEGE